MSNKSRKLSKVIKEPLDPNLLAQGRRVAEEYQVIIQSHGGVYYGRGLELPLVMAEGKSAEACVANTREACAQTVAHILSTGKHPPAPAAEQTRSVQVNIRLTASEKTILEQLAVRKGFRGLSDFVRHAVLAAVE